MVSVCFVVNSEVFVFPLQWNKNKEKNKTKMEMKNKIIACYDFD